MQSSIVINDGNGATVLQEINNALETLATQYLGNAVPSPTYPGLRWIDTSTTPPTIRERNSGDTAWNIVGTADVDYGGMMPVAQPLATITGNTTLAAADFPGIKNITATATVTLPAANAVSAGKQITLKSTTTGLVLIAPAGTDTIEGATGNRQIAAYDTFEMVSNGTSNWLILSRHDIHIGDEKPHAGVTIPAGWLLEDGSAVSRATYAGLFNALAIQTTGTVTSGSNSITAVGSTTNIVVGYPISGPGIPANTTVTAIGTGTLTISQNATASTTGAALVIAPFGVGDGTNTFNLPDRLGRTLIGAGQGSGLSNRILGAKGGEENHTLTTAETAAHNHSASDSGHGHGVNDSGHSHVVAGGTGTGGASNGAFSKASSGGADMSTNGANANIGIQTGWANITVGSTGGGGAHNNMQPYGTTQYLIKI